MLGTQCCMFTDSGFLDWGAGVVELLGTDQVVNHEAHQTLLSLTKMTYFLPLSAVYAPNVLSNK